MLFEDLNLNIIIFMIRSILIPIFLYLSFAECKGVVCSELELFKELEEDLKDNGNFFKNIIQGKLDCLREERSNLSVIEQITKE